MRYAWLGVVFGGYRISCFIHCAEVSAVQRDMLRGFAREHCIGACACSDKDSASVQGDFAVRAFADDGASMSPSVYFHAHGLKLLDDADAFLQRFLDFFVVEAIGGRID